jgi:hypothetical protein
MGKDFKLLGDARRKAQAVVPVARDQQHPAMTMVIFSAGASTINDSHSQTSGGSNRRQ